MSQVYTTQELIRILEAERRACMNGHRLNLSASPTGFSPVLDRFMGTDGIQKLTAYNDFKATIHEYQRHHQISGITWQAISLQNHHLCYPRIHDQLISLAGDLPVIQAAKSTVLTFWWQVALGMDLYLSLSGSKVYSPVAIADVQRIVQRSQWASLSQQGSEECLEIILQLGWGKPEEAAYRHGFPDSGSEHIHAVYPGKYPLG